MHVLLKKIANHIICNERNVTIRLQNTIPVVSDVKSERVEGKVKPMREGRRKRKKEERKNILVQTLHLQRKKTVTKGVS